MKKILLLMLTLIMSVTAWAEEPYFEVIGGSFTSGNVTLKITFPEATSVVLEGTYGAGLYMEHDGTSVSAAYDFTGTLTTDGINTVTAVFNNFTPLEDDAKYYVYSYNMKVDGVAYSDKIYSLESLPYAEVIDGSIGSGNVTVKVTAPRVTSLNFYPTSYPQFYYVALRHNGVEIAQLTIDSSNLTISGNTVSAVYSFTSTGDDNLANYDIYFNQYCLQFNGQWNNNEVIVPFKTNAPDPSGCAHENLTRHEELESTDQIHGHSAYDQCDDCGACFATDDTEHETALTPSDFILPLDEEPIDYFYVQNLDPIRTMIHVPHASLEYRLEGGDGVWRTVTTEEQATLAIPAYQVEVPAYGKVYLRATTTGNTTLPGIFYGGDKYSFPNFVWAGEPYESELLAHLTTYTDSRVHYAIGGDITTLLRSNGKVKTLPEAIVEDVIDGEEIRRGIFESMFENSGDYLNGYLVDASNLKLPSTTLSERCYYHMFYLANLLEHGPQEISATTMAPYSCYEMFNYCYNLQEAPAIKAVTMASHSCERMFGNCRNMTTVPDLEVKTMDEYSCAYMFFECTSLENAPEIPVTTVAANCCEWMFYYCTNMTTAPTILPATTLAKDCYNAMFYNCQLIQRAPELPAPSLVDGCYVDMFNNCRNLNYIKVGLMTDWPVRITYNEELRHNEYDYYCTRNWVGSVNGMGTFCGPTCLFKEIYVGATIYDTVPYYYDGNSFTRWNSETALVVPVTISSVGYSTFCYDYNWIIPEGIEGYIAYVDESGTFHFEKGFNSGDIVQSYRSAYNSYEDGQMIEQWVCRAVVLKGAPGTYNVTLTDTDAPIFPLEDDPNQLNALYGSMHDFDISEFLTLRDRTEGIQNSDYYYYALSLDEDGEHVGFYWMEDDGAPFVTRPYKAFLRARKDLLSSSKNSFVFEDYEDSTGISNISVAPAQKTEGIYDLSGRRMNSVGKSGLYIINGKKVVK